MTVVDIDLPDGCAMASGVVADYPLMVEEALCIERAREKRRRQFASGRHFARLAITRLAGVAPPIPRDKKTGRPVWPEGMVGSISHSESLAAAVVSRATWRGLGIDVEDAHRFDQASPRLRRKLFTEREQSRNRTHPRADAVLFSGKEAAYKAVNPLVGKYIGFREVETEIDWQQRRFWMRYRGEHEPNHLLDGGHGRFRFVGDQVVTLFLVP